MKTKGFLLFVAFCVVSSVSSTAEGVLVAGDVNVSGEVNALDVQVVINAALGLSVEHDCDIDISSEVDAVDVQLVINAAFCATWLRRTSEQTRTLRIQTVTVWATVRRCTTERIRLLRQPNRLLS